MAQFQIEISNIVAPDVSGQARSRTASAPPSDDFASMVDAASDDPPATAAHGDTRHAKGGRSSDESSPRRTDSAAASDRSPPDRAQHANAAPRAGDDRRPRTADADAADATNTTDGDRDTKSDRDDNVITGVAAASPAAVVVPVALSNALAPNGAPADAATNIDIGAATLGKGAAAQTADTDTSGTDAEQGAGANAASPDAGEAAMPAPAKTRVEGKSGKGGKIRAEGAAGLAATAGDESADGPQLQPEQSDASDAAKSSLTAEAAHHASRAAHLDGAAEKSATKDKSDDAASMRSDALQIAAGQAAVDPNSAAAATAAGAEAAIAAGGGASAGAGKGAAATAATSPSDAASTTATLADLGVAIATQAKAGRRSFDISLDPAELGHIHVRLDVDPDGTVMSRLVVDRADTLDLLRRDAPQLQRALQDAGLKADAQTMQFSLRDQNAGHHSGHDTPRSAPPITDPAAGTRSDEIPQTYGRLSYRTGGLDIRI